MDSFMLVEQSDGPTLGYSPVSGVKLLSVDGYAFKDLNRNDSLDAYEGGTIIYRRDSRTDALQQSSGGAHETGDGLRRLYVRRKTV